MAATRDDKQTWIAVIGNTTALPTGLMEALGDQGWNVVTYANAGAFVATTKHPRTVIILSIGVFTMSVIEVIGQLATNAALPVVVFGLEQHPMMVRAALEAGAEDFIAMPITVQATITRLRAIISIRLPGKHTDDSRSEYRLNEADRTVTLPGRPAVRLTLSEYHVFKILLAAINTPVPREHLTRLIAPFTRVRASATLDAIISRLRRKLGADRVITIRNVGYQLAGVDVSDAPVEQGKSRRKG